jgi:hypothetical protein
MPQSPIQTTNVVVSKRQLNITAATVVKAAPGRLFKAVVIVAGAAGTINDCTTTGAAAAANELAALPAVVGPIELNVAFQNGLTITPGAGQTVAVYFN